MGGSEPVLPRLVSLEARLPFQPARRQEMLLGLVLGERWEPAGGQLGPPELGRLAVAPCGRS
jgi:hypothetical protein